MCYSSWVKTQKLTWNYGTIILDSWDIKKGLAQLGTPANI